MLTYAGSRPRGLLPFLLVAWLPCGHGVSPSGEVGTPARRELIRFAALWARSSTPDRRLGRLRGVRLFFDFFCPAGTAFRPPAKFGTPARRAARWGRLWGYAPFSAPLASPPKHPQREFSASASRRGHASYAAGASLTRSARSGDLPPRRVNARVRFRSDQSPLQPNTIMPFNP